MPILSDAWVGWVVWDGEWLRWWFQVLVAMQISHGASATGPKWTPENATSMRKRRGDDNWQHWCEQYFRSDCANVNPWTVDWDKKPSVARVCTLSSNEAAANSISGAQGRRGLRGFGRCRHLGPPVIEGVLVPRLLPFFSHFIFAQFLYFFQAVCYLLHFKCSQP